MMHTAVINACNYTFEYQLVIIEAYLKTVLLLVSDNQGFLDGTDHNLVVFFYVM